MRYTSFAFALLGLSMGACSPPPVKVSGRPVAAVHKSGEQVYQNVCIACHATGVANAPKSGDAEGWRALEAEGQAMVTAHGWVGVRGMPARGGQPELALEEFSRAVAWMARSSGVKWQDPDATMLVRIREEETKRIEALANKSQTGDASYKP